MYQFKSLKEFATFFILASFFPLALAYFVEYVLHHQPCILCLYQRIPYFLIFILSICFFFFSDKFTCSAAFMITTLLIISAALAFYHIGIEQGFFEETAACRHSNKITPLSLEELKEQIMHTKAKSCKEIDIKILGFSMAQVNLIYSIALIFLNLKQNFKGKK